MVVSSALAEASSSSGSSSSTTVLTKPGVLDQFVFDSGVRGSDGAQDLLFKHLQEAEVNEECASESACAADEDVRQNPLKCQWALSCVPWTRKHQREPHECVAGCRVRQGVFSQPLVCKGKRWRQTKVIA